MKRSLLLLSVLCLAGCISHRELSVQVPATVPIGTPIGVTVPPDATFESDEYTGSGVLMANDLIGALAEYYPGSAITSSSSNAAYLLKPQILHWEDHATEWNDLPDKIKISLPLYHNGKLVGSAIARGSSSLWTFGGDKPQFLLPRLFSAYAALLAVRPVPDSAQVTVKQGSVITPVGTPIETSSVPVNVRRTSAPVKQTAIAAPTPVHTVVAKPKPTPVVRTVVKPAANGNTVKEDSSGTVYAQ